MGLFGSLIDLFRSRHFDIKWQVNTAAANDSTIASALFRCRALIKIISDTCTHLRYINKTAVGKSSCAFYSTYSELCSRFDCHECLSFGLQLLTIVQSCSNVKVDFYILFSVIYKYSGLY